MQINLPYDSLGLLNCDRRNLRLKVLRSSSVIRVDRKVDRYRLAFLRSESARATADIQFGRKEHHAYLELPRTDDEFLAKVCRPTRHNLCGYRRRSELAGNELCADQPFTEFCGAGRCLLPKTI
jgi:hypothetical protein